MEIGGRNKNAHSLICLALENLLTDVYLKWKSVFIVTGYFNIDLLGEPK